MVKTDANTKRIRETIRQLRKDHLDELSRTAMAPVLTVAYMASLNAYSRVRDHIHSIADDVSEER